MKGYTEKEDVEKYLLLEIDASFDVQIAEWIEAMEAYIDQETGRNFIADSAASERLYDGDGEDDMFIDDCVSITKVEVDDDEIDTDDYYLYPANSLPITKIVLDSAVFAKGRQNVAITAKWGYSAAVPADIKLACTVLVSGIVNEGAKSDGEVKTVSMGRYSVTYKDAKGWQDLETVKATLAKYRRMTI